MSETYKEIFLKKLKKECSVAKIDLSNLLPIFNISNNYEASMFITNFINFAMNGEKSKKINDALKIFLNIIFNVSDAYSNSFKHMIVDNDLSNEIDLKNINIKMKEFYRKNLKILKGSKKQKNIESLNFTDTCKKFEEDLDKLCLIAGIDIYLDLEEIGACQKERVQNVLFEYNVIQLLFYFLSKFKNEMKMDENSRLMVKIVKLFKFSVCKNVSNQFLVLQSDFLKIMEFILKEYWREGKFFIQFYTENFETHIIFCDKFFRFIIDRIRVTRFDYYSELIFYWKIVEKFVEKKVLIY